MAIRGRNLMELIHPSRGEGWSGWSAFVFAFLVLAFPAPVFIARVVGREVEEGFSEVPKPLIFLIIITRSLVRRASLAFFIL